MNATGNPPTKLLIAWSCLVVVGLTLLSLVIPALNLKAPRAKGAVAINSLKHTLIACRAYAADHDGLYPPALGALYPDYLDDLDRLFATDEKGRKRILIYHPGLTDTSHSRKPLIEHPIRVGTKRIIGYAGGHIVEVQDP